MSIVFMPPKNKPIVTCGWCRAQLWFKDGDFINDGIWCSKCMDWNAARGFEDKIHFPQEAKDE